MEFRQTYTQIIPKEQNSLLWKMSRESAKAFNAYIEIAKTEKKSALIAKKVEETVERKYQLAQSFQASYQLAYTARKGYFEALKAYKKDPSKFSGKPKPPAGDNFLQVITFKKEAIRRADGKLLLSTGFRKNPIEVKWSDDMSLPVFATIKMELKEWKASFMFENEITPTPLGTNTLGIDLGIKRLAATFDGQEIVLYNGKKVMSYVQLRNKKQAELNSIRDTRKSEKRRGYTRREHRIKKGLVKQIRAINRKINDILHKYSRYIVDKAVSEGIGNIVIGDCSGIHQIEKGPTFNKKHKEAEQSKNQKVNQGQEIKLGKMIDYKFVREGGHIDWKSEAFTSQDCPACDHRNIAENRVYRCSNCNLVYDRDGVGSINIRGKKVAQGSVRAAMRSGTLAVPRGVKYHSQMSFDSKRVEVKTAVSRLQCESKLVSEPPML